MPTDASKTQADSKAIRAAAAISVSVPTPLRRYTGGSAMIALRATDVAALLDRIEHQYPALHRSICDDIGAVRRHINLFVNNDHIRELSGIGTPLQESDVVTIMTAVSGG